MKSFSFFWHESKLVLCSISPPREFVLGSEGQGVLHVTNPEQIVWVIFSPQSEIENNQRKEICENTKTSDPYEQRQLYIFLFYLLVSK